MDQTDKPIIKIENLSVVFGQGGTNELKALNEVSLDIYPHEYLILFGPSGCGKSTLLNVISGLLKPTNGTVKFEDHDLSSLTEKEKLYYHRFRIGMIFQSFYLIPTLSVIDNVCLPRSFIEYDSAASKKDGLNLLKRFGVGEQAEKFPRDLSGGQRQRVSIARSLINSPSIIVADEPVGNLDSRSAFNVLSILQELNEVDKKLIILVTHDPSHLAFGDRVIHMQDGKIIKIIEVLDKQGPKIGGDEEFIKERDKISKEWESFKGGVLGRAWELYKNGELEKDWELVKKEELGQAWESFQKGELDKDWELGKEFELVRKGDLEKKKEEHIPPDLLALMRSFRNFTPEQVGTLLVPFKAQQIFAHVFFHIQDNQIELAKKIFQDYIAGGISLEDLEKRLTEEETKGGAGWDRYHAKQLTGGIGQIFEQAKQINLQDASKSAEALAEYLIGKFKLRIGEMENIKFVEYVKMRLENELVIDEFLGLIDRPMVKGGVGLDKRKAVKTARELEIIMLVRYAI